MPVCGRGRYGYMTAMLVAASLALAGFLLAGCGGDGQNAASSVPVEQEAEDVRQAAARVVNACAGTAQGSTACARQIRELETLVRGSGPSPQIGTGGEILRACNDGVDNDGDGLIDSPDDPGCFSGTDNDESDPPPSTTTTAPKPQCNDGQDNDSDGMIDGQDAGCRCGVGQGEYNPDSSLHAVPFSRTSVRQGDVVAGMVVLNGPAAMHASVSFAVVANAQLVGEIIGNPMIAQCEDRRSFGVTTRSQPRIAQRAIVSITATYRGVTREGRFVVEP